MTAKLSRAAEADLLNIFLYSLNTYGPVQAERYKTLLDRAFTRIADTPEIARLRHEIHPPIRVYPCGKHVIVYTVQDEGTVLVLRIRHHREDWAHTP